jgi:transmembrane sensor
MAILNGIDDPVDLPTPIEREGLAWVELVVSGKATRADLQALAKWRGQSRAHHESFAAAVKVHRLIGEHIETDLDYFSPSFLERASTRRSAILGFAVVGLGGYAAVNPPLSLWPSYAELASDYHTATGERRQIGLTTGISVQMNTRSSVSLRSGTGGPGIELVNGEIAVSAEQAFPKPFFVHVGTNRVFANQAGFDVRYDGNKTCVTCLKGRVGIEGSWGRFDLTARQQAQASNAGFGHLTTVDPNLVTAWQRGAIIFHDESLDTVVSEINRYRPGKIVITNSSLARTRFSGEFSILRLEDALHQIAKVANASATQLPGGIVVLS